MTKSKHVLPGIVPRRDHVTLDFPGDVREVLHRNDAEGDGGVTLYRDGTFTRVATEDDFGPRVVESLAPEGVSYTAYADDAIATVDRGDAAAAFLLQPVTVDQVARFALAGETMPQKSTFFFPKLTSGLLFFPVG